MTYQTLESMGFKINIVENFIPNVKHAEINAKKTIAKISHVANVFIPFFKFYILPFLSLCLKYSIQILPFQVLL